MTPATWVTAHAGVLPSRGDALDVACGRGRHALWLAQRGLAVHAVDRDPALIAALQREAARRRLAIRAEVHDLEQRAPPLAPDAYDVIVVTLYLHRPLFPALLAALRPGGILIAETFTRAQALRGRPTNPDYLLEEGELERLVQPLELLDYREGTFDDREVASVVARRPAVMPADAA